MPFDLSEGRIRDHASSESFGRGEDYYRQGAVLSLTRRGGVLRAEVAGSEFAPYGVRVAFDEAGITEAACGCPYDWGGWCKHIVAALLACLREPESVEERPAVEEVLSGLDRDGLRTILLRLAERDPSLADVVESEISLSVSYIWGRGNYVLATSNARETSANLDFFHLAGVRCGTGWSVECSMDMKSLSDISYARGASPGGTIGHREHRRPRRGPTRPSPLPVPGAWVLFFIRPDKIVTFGIPFPDPGRLRRDR